MSTGKKARAEVAQELAAELRDIEARLSILQCDAQSCKFHRADIRLGWLRLSVKTCGDGLAMQAGKLKGRA